MIIALEGGICSGKTTLSNYSTQFMPAKYNLYM